MPAALLTTTPQSSLPALLNPVQHAAQRARAVVQAEVLIEAQEHHPQMRLLVPNWLKQIHLEPQLHFADEALARLDARFPVNGHGATTSPRLEMDEAKEGEGLWPYGRPIPDHLATGCHQSAVSRS